MEIKDGMVLVDALIEKTIIHQKKVSVALTAGNLRNIFNLPDNARIVVQVPGGGDWSNTELNLDEHTLDISWTQTEENSDG